MDQRLTLPAHDAVLEAFENAVTAIPAERIGETVEALRHASDGTAIWLDAASRHARAIADSHGARTRRTLEALGDVTLAMRGEDGKDAAGALADYLRDAWQRWILTLDVLRERGDIFLEHEAAGCPPVLGYDYEVVMDGADLPRPCNYVLLRIVPPEGCTVLNRKRPYVIIDPRAGHGAGIGGFKPDSQVGVALKDGHPVYFVAFRRDPEPGQTLADVAHAEAEFVREVMRRHPDSPNPAVAGNCQGGWACLLMAATHPDLRGPVVLNGAPVAAWSARWGGTPCATTPASSAAPGSRCSGPTSATADSTGRTSS